jgi:hypothetical protein
MLVSSTIWLLLRVFQLRKKGVIMSKRFSIQLVVLAIVSGLVSGVVSGRFFATRSAVATVTKQKVDANFLSLKSAAISCSTLDCNSLRVVDFAGKEWVTIGIRKFNGQEYSMIDMYNANGTVLSLKGNPEGGILDICGEHGKGSVISVIMSADENGGYVTVWDKSYKAGASMEISKYGYGSIYAWGKDGYKLR